MSSYYPRPKRTYIETIQRNDRARRRAEQAFAAEHADVIRACNALDCPSDPRFTHLLDNQLTCARCGNTAATILERQYT